MSLKNEDNHHIASSANSASLLEKCAKLAHSRSILSELDRHLREHGFAGSTAIPQLVFLSAYTRMFDDPVSLAIKGQSGCGKSFALHAGLRYLPEAAYHEVHGLSQKALVHSSRLNLQHRHLVIQELAGFAKGEGWVFLRQLLTEGRIKYMTVAQTKDGHEGRDLPPVEGPIGLMMTTTANALHGEDDTRLLSVHVDQSPEQIRRALMIHAGSPPPKPPAEDLAQWHALHELVVTGDPRIVIPYREALLSNLPATLPRVLRDAPKVIALIKAHALLHRLTRDTQHGAVVATLEDYKEVFRLVAEPLAYGLKADVPPSVREVIVAALDLYAEVGGPVTQVQIAKRLNRDQGVVSRNLAAAINEGYLGNLNPGQGRSHAYVPGDRDMPSGSVLPSPRELEAAIAEPAKLVPREQIEDFEEWAEGWPHSVPAR